jgi:hypothetical protein
MQNAHKFQMGALLFLAACLGLAACGLTTGGPIGPLGSQNSGTSTSCGGTVTAGTGSGSVVASGSASTVVVVATGTGWLQHLKGTVTPVLPFPTVQATITSGQVTLTSDSTQFSACAPIKFVIANGLSSAIVATDHHTACTLVVVEHQVDGIWQPGPACLLETPTRLLRIPAGVAIEQKLSGGLPAGTYRASFTYVPFSSTGSGGQGAGGQGATVFSTTFTVG